MYGLKIGSTGTIGDGVVTSFRGGRTGELITGDAHARYQEAVSRGNCFYLSTTAAAPTAYTGAAAGTPLLAVWNSSISGTASARNIVVLAISVATNVAASVAGTASIDVYTGTSVKGTGTVTQPSPAYASGIVGASIGAGFVNTALTGSTALNYFGSVHQYYWATAAAAVIAPSWFFTDGLIVVAPGAEVAVGANAALTSAKYQISMIWEEVPLT